MPLPPIRLTFLILFLGAMGLIGVGMYMQMVLGLKPCALCITQRIFIVATGVMGLIGFLVNPAKIGRVTVASLGALMAIIGGGFSSRQIWLQSLPADQVPSCGPSIDYVFENFPLADALSLLLRGDGNCAEVSWSFLGLSIPSWTLVAFSGMVLINVWQALRSES